MLHERTLQSIELVWDTTLRTRYMIYVMFTIGAALHSNNVVIKTSTQIYLQIFNTSL